MWSWPQAVTLGCPQELTDAFTLMTFSFLNPIEAVEGSTQVFLFAWFVCHCGTQEREESLANKQSLELWNWNMQAPVLRGGVCHGVVLWIDWVFDPLGDIVLSTRPAGLSITFNFYGIKQILYYSSVWIEQYGVLYLKIWINSLHQLFHWLHCCKVIPQCPVI